VEGDSKPYARIKVLKTIVEKLSQELDYDPFDEQPASNGKGKKSKGKKKKGK
jgi:hypothetical protein